MYFMFDEVATERIEMTYHMKLLKADDVIRDFQGGRNIFRRPSMFSMVVEVERLRDKVADLTTNANCTQCKEPGWCEIKGQLDAKDAEIARLTAEIESLKRKLNTKYYGEWL